MRKHLISWLLPLFMLLTQQGAVWHDIGHLTDALRHAPAKTSVLGASGTSSATQTAASGTTDDLAAHESCDLCLAFAHLAASAYSDPLPLVLVDASHVQSPAAAWTTRTTAAPSPRSRGPPLSA